MRRKAGQTEDQFVWQNGTQSDEETAEATAYVGYGDVFCQSFGMAFDRQGVAVYICRVVGRPVHSRRSNGTVW